MPGSLHRAGFVHIDMPALRRNHPLIRAQCRIDQDHIGLCSPNQEMDRGIFPATGSADAFGCPLTINVRAVSGRLFIVGLCQAAKNLRVRPLCIVAVKPEHPLPLLWRRR